MSVFFDNPPLDADSPEPVPDTSAADEVSPEELEARRRKLRLLGVMIVIAAMLAALFTWYLVNRKPLSQLPGLDWERVPAYKFSVYGVSEPLGVAVTPSGDRIYVTQSGGDRTTKVFDDSGQEVGVLVPSDSSAPSHMPVYVAVNPLTEDVYVTDRTAREIYVYDRDGNYLRQFIPKARGKKWQPLGIGFDEAGNVTVTDVAGKQRILVFSPDGELIRELGSPGLTSFPNGVAVDGAGNTIVSDSNNGRVLLFDGQGNVVAEIKRGSGPGDTSMPRGVAVADGHLLYVADTTNQRVQLYDIAGLSQETGPRLVGLFGAEGSGEGLFEFPNGAAADARSHVYITDRVNDRVQVWGY
ncbi:MAG: NHL repeat-containing protein [Candidatus Nanopelagicales bacterium]|nr:NHL repeat-containing protein [Candidatus Nanopelagicales bacterium]MDZ4250129.1 NHL repeat-containing protein [Candidatus Nanopelagicales bacterium]